MGGAGVRWGVLGLWALLLGCAPWDLAQLEARHPALARVGAAPLAHLVPYFIAQRDVLTAFTCRWPDGATLGVHVAGERTTADERILDAALAAWNRVGLPVRFARGQQPSRVEVRFGEPASRRSGAAVVDCRARPGSGERLDAELVFAQLTLRRQAVDWRGQRVPLSDAERLGAALHELGHALGFQGHPQRGDTVMVRSVDHVRWTGEVVLQGRPFRDAALAALYAIPSGTRLARLALSPGRTAGLDRAARRAQAAGSPDWWIRVGDDVARLHWGPGTARFVVLRMSEIFRDPRTFEVIPSTDS